MSQSSQQINSWTGYSPAAWKIDRLKDCLESVVGGDWGDDPGSDIEGEDLVVLRVADFSNGGISDRKLTTRRIKNSKIIHRLVSDKTLLIEKSGGGEKQWVGRAVYPGQLPYKAICSNFIAKVDVSSKIVPNFLNYLFSTLYDTGANKPHVRQTTGIQNLSVTHYLGINVSIPATLEQKRIALYLDKSCKAIDQAVKAKQKQLKTLDVMRKSIIQRAVTQGLDPDVEMVNSGVDWLGMIPKHWQVKKLKRVFSSVDYGISESTNQEGNFAVLKMGNLVKGEIIFTKIEYVRAVSSQLILDKNDLLFNRTNSLDQVAKVGIFRGELEDNVTYASYLVRLRADHKTNPHYLNYLVNSEAFLGLARKMAIPSVQQANLNPTRYCRLESPTPPLTEQKKIAEYLENKTKQIADIEKCLTGQINTLRDYRKSLIHECVTGKRRITETDIKEIQTHV